MKGDFSTVRFNPAKQFNRVLKQQGRVDLDSDWNEQAAISQYLLRRLIVDLLGPYGGPAGHCGFELLDPTTVEQKPVVGDFLLGAGRYYVDGLMIENTAPVWYSAQSSVPEQTKLNAGKRYLAYLDVWERHVTWLEDDSIREVALGGPDTTTRVQTMWQVRTLEATPAAQPVDREGLKRKIEEAQKALEEQKVALDREENRDNQAKIKRNIAKLEKQIADLTQQLEAGANAPAADAEVSCTELLQPLRDWTSGTMAVRLQLADPTDSPCVLPASSGYRGLENHLYRIEVHTSGDTADVNKAPTFKWSRENGSIATRWLSTTANDVRVGTARDFAAGQWLEFTTEADELLGRPGPLTRVTRVDGDTVTVDSAPAWNVKAVLPKVRRWDQTANDEITLVNGAVPLKAGAGDQGWITIENGIQVQFSGGKYRSGDYWLITARVATGDIDWPKSSSPNTWISQAPNGVEHHYAPLFTLDATGNEPFATLVKDCRCRFASLPCLPAGQ